MLKHVNVKSKKITFKTTGISISKKKHRNLLKITNIEHIQCPIQTNIYPDESGAWFDGNERDANPFTEMYQENNFFFGFPFSWIWNNSLNLVKYAAGTSERAISQLHIIQEFDISSDNGTEIVNYSNDFVCVAIKVLQYSNLDRRLVTACSACDSHCNLLMLVSLFLRNSQIFCRSQFNTLNFPLPEYNEIDAFGCRHSTALLVGILRTQLSIRDLRNSQDANHFLCQVYFNENAELNFLPGTNFSFDLSTNLF